MEVTKKDKYVLLNDESDIEEYDKTTVGLIPPNHKDGKKYSSKTRVRRRCSACCHLRWGCHTFFIFLLLISQVILSLAFVKLYWDLGDIKREQFAKEMSGLSIQYDQNVAMENTEKTSNEHLNSRLNSLSSQNIKSLEDKVSTMDKKMRILELMVEDLQGNSSGMIPNAKVTAESAQLPYNKATALSIQLMKEDILHMEVLMNSLSQQFDILENSTVSWFSTLQDQFNNVTEVVNHLESRIDEGVHTALSQIVQLRDDIRRSKIVTVNHKVPEVADISVSSYTGVSSHLTHPTGNPTWSPSGTTLQGHKVLTENDNTDGDVQDQTSFADYSSGMEAATVQQPPTVENDITEEKYSLDIPSIKNVSDLKAFFYNADADANGYLSHTEIVNFLQEKAPKKEEIERFDEDQNDMYSYSEILKALHLDE